jgi:hypothetical protein
MQPPEKEAIPVRVTCVASLMYVICSDLSRCRRQADRPREKDSPEVSLACSTRTRSAGRSVASGRIVFAAHYCCIVVLLCCCVVVLLYCMYQQPAHRPSCLCLRPHLVSSTIVSPLFLLLVPACLSRFSRASSMGPRIPATITTP